jgi:RNA methyltransferase, TrmH family
MITSTKNPRIIEARKLNQRKYRLRQNRFMVEGLQLLSLAVEAMPRSTPGHAIIPKELFYCEELFSGATAPRLLKQLTQAGVEAIPVAAHVMDSLSERDTSQGLAATFALRELEGTISQLLQVQKPTSSQRQTGGATLPAHLILILDRLQDPGNLGTLIRTADAAGLQGIILLEPGVDPFDPKTVRGTMGSIFNVPFARTAKVEDFIPLLARQRYRLVGADATRGQTVWDSQALSGSVALVLGNEARGLSEDLQQSITDYLSLPLYGRAESLNVAVAGGILMYEWLRVNNPK